jgi:DNA ligase-associated metallophosphoesterase
LHLTPERAVYWPAERTMFIADTHLGKAAVFRARGLPVPRGTTSSTLQRLSQALARLPTQRLVVLGDFLHARESQATGTVQALRTWREAHAALECLIVQGNHDRHAGRIESALGFTLSTTPYVVPGLIGVHEAHEADGLIDTSAPAERPLVLAGHVHPVVTLTGKLDRLRLPCYVLRDGVLTLPSFGDFTGGYDIGTQGNQIFIVSDRVRAL